MMQEAVGMWGSCDMAVQLFIKQKHINRSASIMRYHTNKSGHVYRSTVINAKNQFDKFEKTTQNVIEEYR
jgi:hypothetical protein